MTLQEKEALVKMILEKKQKARVFSITSQGQIEYAEIILNGYRIIGVAGIILALYEIEGIGNSVINADLLQVYDEEKKDWIDLFYSGDRVSDGVTMMPPMEPVKREEENESIPPVASV